MSSANNTWWSLAQHSCLLVILISSALVAAGHKQHSTATQYSSKGQNDSTAAMTSSCSSTATLQADNLHAACIIASTPLQVTKLT
jgi:hypothetical protein